MQSQTDITIERNADFGIIVEKSYVIDLIYEHLKTKEGVQDLLKTLNPIWGEHILYFNYQGKNLVILSAKGAPVAVNAVERIRRTGGKYIVFLGTCGSTDESIEDGTFILSKAAVRDEGVTSGYLDLKVPALSNLELTLALKQELENLHINPLLGVTYTTDKRYKENPDELQLLFQKANVLNIDMETSAILLTAAYHGILATTVKIVTDCAVKHTQGELKGIFDRSKDFTSFVNPKILLLLDAVLNLYRKVELPT
ncbi:MAG: hypothetical protein AAGU75_17405 [Bacillota bacterium]